MKTKSPKKTTALGRVSLRYYFPFASAVGVSGSFNGWDATGTPLHRSDDGYWTIDLDLAPDRHEFRLIVDGDWSDVPDAVETVENPFGFRNAVLTVPPAT